MKRSTGPMRASVPASSTAIVQRLIDLIEKSYALRITLASLSKALRRKLRFGVTAEVYRRRRGGDRHKSGLAIPAAH